MPWSCCATSSCCTTGTFFQGTARLHNLEGELMTSLEKLEKTNMSSCWSIQAL